MEQIQLKQNRVNKAKQNRLQHKTKRNKYEKIKSKLN